MFSDETCEFFKNSDFEVYLRETASVTPLWNMYEEAFLCFLYC